MNNGPNRITTSRQLTAEEQAQLEGWYVASDKAEMRLLAQSITQSDVSEQDIPVLWSQVKAGLVQLAATTEQIQQVMLENEALRQEIAGLKQQFFAGRAA